MSPCFTFRPSFFQDFKRCPAAAAFIFVFQILRPSELGGGFVPARAFHGLEPRGWRSLAGSNGGVENRSNGQRHPRS